jgi:hypothetical protein
MSHTVDTYYDIQSKGIEFLRGIYSRPDLSTRPKLTISKHEIVIETIRHVLTPAELARVEEAYAESDTKCLDPVERQRDEIPVLGKALRDSLKPELLTIA